MKAFFTRIFIVKDPLTDDQPDERVQLEAHAEYSRVYFLFLALIIAATVGQLFFTRHIVAFLPAFVGGAGSLIYFIVMYKREGLFKRHAADERITHYKARVKSRCYNFCLSVYIFGALPMLFLDIDVAALGLVIATWFIPTCIAVVRIVRRGLYAPGSKTEAKIKYRELAKATAKSAVFFGVFMSFIMAFTEGAFGTFESVPNAVWVLSRNAFLYAAMWGVLFYFAMLGVDKISEKFANRRLKKSEEANGENNTDESE